MAQLVDLRGVLASLGRRYQVLLAVFLLSVIGAAAFVAVSPTTYQATVRVVLPPPPVNPDGTPQRDIETEVQIITSAAVLRPTATSVQPPISLQDLERTVSVRGVTNQILEIDASAGQAGRAAQLANAVASAYVAYADDTATAEANATGAAYAQQVKTLTDQVGQLNQQIVADTAALSGLSPAAAQRQQSVIDSLQSQQSILAGELSSDQTQIGNAQLQAQLSRQGTQVLQPALVPKSPVQPRPLFDLGIGGVAGLLIGGIVALAVETGDRRLRTRDAMAAAAGAPVLASITAAEVDTADALEDFLRYWSPSVVEGYTMLQTLARLEPGDGVGEPPCTVVLVSLPGDQAAGAVALQLAVFAAARPVATAFVFASHDDTTAALRRACDRASATAGASRPTLSLLGATGGVDAGALEDRRVIVTLVVAESSPLVIPTWDRRSRVALVVSCGHATAEALEEATAACLEAGHVVRGVVVVDPDPRDHTTGQRSLALGDLVDWVEPAASDTSANGHPSAVAVAEVGVGKGAGVGKGVAGQGAGPTAASAEAGPPSGPGAGGDPDHDLADRRDPPDPKEPSDG